MVHPHVVIPQDKINSINNIYYNYTAVFATCWIRFGIGVNLFLYLKCKYSFIMEKKNIFENVKTDYKFVRINSQKYTLTQL